MSDLYFDVMPRIPEKHRQEAIELIRVLEMDDVNDEDIKEQEKAEKRLRELLQND